MYVFCDKHLHLNIIKLKPFIYKLSLEPCVHWQLAFDALSLKNLYLTPKHTFIKYG